MSKASPTMSRDRWPGPDDVLRKGSGTLCESLLMNQAPNVHEGWGSTGYMSIGDVLRKDCIYSWFFATFKYVFDLVWIWSSSMTMLFTLIIL